MIEQSEVYARTSDGLLRILQPISITEMANILSEPVKREIVGVPAYWCGSIAYQTVFVWPTPEQGIEIHYPINGVSVMIQ